jgi:hypothetical protein
MAKRWSTLYTGWFKMKGQYFRRWFFSAIARKKKFIWTCVQFWTFIEIVHFWIFNYESIVNGNTELQITVNCILILIFSWQIYYNFQKIFRSLTVSFVCEDHALFVGVDLHVSFPGQQYPKCKRVVRLLYPPFFCKLRCSSNLTNKNVRDLDLEIQRAVSR